MNIPQLLTGDCLTIMPTLQRQKPVPLLEWLVLTYSNKGETVLDNCMGSGSAGIAALKHGRQFIGIENDPVMAATAAHRILTHNDLGNRLAATGRREGENG